jgi:hypothetical protein
MDASQLLEVVGKRVWPSEAAVLLEMTPEEAEDLLDWIENHAGTNPQVNWDIKDFTVQCVCPSRLLSARAVQSSKAGETVSSTNAIERY